MFKLRLWFRRFWRKHSGQTVTCWEKNAKYLEAFPWLIPLIPLKFDVNNIKIQRVAVGNFDEKSRSFRGFGGCNYYLAGPRGEILTSVGRRFALFQKKTVYEAFAGLGGLANTVKYIVWVEWTRDKTHDWNFVRIVIYKFPPGVMPLDHAASLIEQWERERRIELEGRQHEHQKRCADQNKKIAEEFEAELALVDS